MSETKRSALEVIVRPGRSSGGPSVRQIERLLAAGHGIGAINELMALAVPLWRCFLAASLTVRKN